MKSESYLDILVIPKFSCDWKEWRKTVRYVSQAVERCHHNYVYSPGPGDGENSNDLN